MRKAILIVLVICAVYTRLTGIDWGLPYPLHPDERNMVVALQQLHCELPVSNECYNPHFFAYGQLPLYIGYVLLQVSSLLLTGAFEINISFESATLALRMISVFASWGMLFVVYRILKDFFSEFFSKNTLLIVLFVFILSPYTIQFAHFGTTESLLMFLYLLIVYLSLEIISQEKINLKTIALVGVVGGLAIGIKISSTIFLLLPVLLLFHKNKKRAMLLLGLVSILFTFITSPHMFISWKEFLGSMKYESGVAQGTIQVFYTRQFLFSSPLGYQLTKIFPVALGIGQYIFFGLGFFLLSWKEKRINLLRLAFLLYFIPTSFLFVKWTRFVSPILPLASIFGVLVLGKITKNDWKVLSLLVGVLIIPGVIFLTIFQKPDIRFQASEWIYQNIPPTARVFSEAGNVINIPIPPAGYAKEIPNFQVINFDFYSVDSNKVLQDELVTSVGEADYIIIPSRRVMGSVTCSLPFSEVGYSKERCEKLKKLYPVSNEYYDTLLSGKLGFTHLKTFSAAPYDEQFDETWSVFDHPVIRIYKKNETN